MGSNGGRTRELPEKHAHTEVTGAHGGDRSSFSGNNNNSSSNLNEDDIAYVEITADIVNDALVHSVKTVRDADVEDTELSLLRSSTVGNAFKQVSQQLKRLTSLATTTPSRFDRTGSAATYNALNGLKFINQTDGDGWIAVESKFDKLTAETNGLLPRHLFGECIGMNKESQPEKSEKQKQKLKQKQQQQNQKQRQKENEKQREKEKKEPEDFAGELFDALRRRRYISRDFIDKAEMREFWDQLSDQKFDSRLQTFFDMVDKDADGRITKAELTEIIKLSASANKLSNIQKKQTDEYAALIMEEMDPDNFGYIRIEVLEMVLLKSLPQAASGEDQTLSQMLSKQLITTRGDGYPLWRRYQDFKYFLHDNWKRVWVLVLWIAVMASLFTWKYLQYKNKKDVYQVMGHCVCMAKGAAETLKLNMALILLPVCRNTITWLRNKTKLGKAVPFDDNLKFHFVVAIGIGLGVGIHGIYHLACDFPRLLHASEEKYKPMEKYFGEQPSNYWWFLKGWEGVTGIIMVVLMAIAFTLASPWLRSPKTSLPKPQKELTRFDAFCHSIHLFLQKLTGFNAFWYSHHLFVIVYACLIIHGIKLYLTKDWYKKTTWMYIAVPVILYCSERLIRALRSSIMPANILDVAFYPGGVTALHMTKPQNFRYKSGQYMFVNCAAVSPFEWHPFSITSSPGDDYLSVHIRDLGDWTGEIRKVFSKVCLPHPDGKQDRFRDDGLQGPNSKYPRVLIDGPYGAPAQEYKQYEVVLLVGLGIGATPMISIVKDIVNNMKAKEEEKNALENGLFTSPMAANTPSPMISTSKRKSGSSSTANDEFKTTKAYFYWVTKEQGSFDWFKGVMNEVAELDDKGVIEMHNYCTSVYEEGDPRSVFITMLQSINHAKNGVDVVSGTRVKSHFAKPNWKNVYNSIAQNHMHSRVGVFFCGQPMASIEVKKHASEFTQKTSTKFDFHKEIF